jgi:hypothetical protein
MARKQVGKFKQTLASEAAKRGVRLADWNEFGSSKTPLHACATLDAHVALPHCRRINLPLLGRSVAHGKKRFTQLGNGLALAKHLFFRLAL